jgi:pyruvate dehydrogenase E2 component (dihydrolipoamide acetyltransferase)
MPIVIMPRLSESMTDGTVVRWLKADGERVQRGEELVQIETDKVTMVYEADSTGVLRILVAEGATLPVGAQIGEIHGDARPNR